MKGIKRFRQAIKNQQDAGGGEFRLAYHDAEEIAAEIEEEFGWAQGVPALVDADGNVVPLTTKVMYGDDGREVQVNHFRLAGHNFGDRLKWRVREMSGAVLDLGYLRLYVPDSWEKLEKDVDRIEIGDIEPDVCNYFSENGMKCSKCPAHSSTSCKVYIIYDVLRRAKALAERDGKGAEQ